MLKVCLMMMRLLIALVSKPSGYRPASKSQPDVGDKDVGGTVFSRTKKILAEENVVELCFKLLK